MASAIVTAQTEIHMIGPHDWFTAQRAYGDGSAGPDANRPDWVRSIKAATQSPSGRTDAASYCGHGHNISSGVRIDDQTLHNSRGTLSLGHYRER